MSYGISRNGRLPPSQTMPLCLFTALRHSDHKSGRLMAIVTERWQINASSQKLFLV